MGLVEPSPALALNWVYGTSSKVKSSLINLSDGHSERICYIAAHTGVIYDKRTRKQSFLQGHCNSITCMLATEDRTAIITADEGNESMLVLWNSRSGNPIKSIPQAHAHGITAMDLSPGGEWLATVSAPAPGCPSVLSAIPAGDVQLAVRFNMNNINELITNGRRRVYFWSSQHPTSRRFKYYSPPLRSKDFKQNVGDFVMSVFVPGSLQALTATTDGDVVLWDEQGITAQMGTKATDRRASKLMRIHQQAITFLGTIGDYIVSGAKDGFVRFYDPLLRIVAWFEDLEAGPVTSVSFSTALPSKLSTAELADTINRFMVPDFVVLTEESRIVEVPSASFEEFDAAKRKGVSVLDPMLADVVGVVCHPHQAELCVLGHCGSLQRWDMVDHICVARRSFTFKNPGEGANTVCYSRDGSLLVVGLDAGYVYIMNTADLTDVHAARNTTAAILMISMAVTGGVVAVADSNHQVLLYAYLPYKHIKRWEFVGKAKVHHAAIVGLCFGETPSGSTRLFSLGADARIVEYDLQASSPTVGLKILYHQDFAPPDVPTALAFAPPMPYFKHFSTQTLLLIADDAYKIKLYSPDQRACVCTYLGPTFSGPLQQLTTFKSPNTNSAFLAYATAERVVGLVGWPMDGDPSNSLGLIAHPGLVSSLAISYDGRRLVTSGPDGTLGVWSVSTQALESQTQAAAALHAAAGGRWAAVLDNPELLEQLQDYFYYAQVRAQGEDTIEPRNIQGTVPVSMVPDLMRAAGFYPSNAAISDIMHHISFVAQCHDMDKLHHVDLETFLMLYSNHRPLFDVSTEDITAAFVAFGKEAPGGRMHRDKLLAVLRQFGEAVHEDEIAESLQALTGEERAEAALPPLLDAQVFANEILGFEEQEAS
ncbi:WD40-repeat-containing domain protein [Dunaliella salina]|uniref:Cilia- and flagella-associated protein 251 n=2 Tax=Dunaliella salina TaxID=3046 RepID=A0ABQ7H4K9_DUNSA|nr:WD40-repeat-containing domain protein [Dunaliella salina]|eukprot:KAF5841782.1 WD40-repeat-containing domain protein [Dunaliella salina]